MNEFISKYRDQISGVISGFDRLVFRGNLALNHEAGMKGYLWAKGVAWKDYAQHVEEVSQRVKRASLASMEACGRPIRYLSSAKQSKEAMARMIAREDGIASGPVCAFTAVEPCFSWRVAGNRETQKVQLLRSMRQCLFVYHYWIDLPFALYVYMNGREWRARQMDEAGVQYRRHDNCFSWIEDFSRI
jgi:hypothetical protein